MRAVLRALLASAVVLGLTFSAASPAADASTADLDLHDCAFQSGLGNGECEHFLRNPEGAVDDPCWCDKCRNAITNQHHDGKTIPPGWNPQLFETGGMDAYLKRHSLAWGITCSECLQSEKPWPDGKSDKEPGTVPAKDWAGHPAKDTVLKRLAVESKLFRKSENAILAYDKHFYVCADVEPLKVRMPAGSSRVMSRHEWVHLMIERAEFARREWERNLGPTMVESQKANINNPIPQLPIAIFFSEKESDFDRISAEYFKTPGAKGLRGSGNMAHMCGGMCLGGFGWSKEKLGDDHQMATYLRHRLAHALLAVWGGWETRPKSIPVWMDEGLAHWLTKSVEQYRNDAAFCSGEGGGGTKGSGAPTYGKKEWDKDVLRYVGGGKLGPIQELLDKTVVTDLTEEDLKRSWSYCDFCLTEWREPFVKLLRALRMEKELHAAFKECLNCDPEDFDARWRDRVTGKRKSMAPTEADARAENEDAEGARTRKSILAENDPKVLAAKVKLLGEIKDKKTIPVVLDVIARNLDLPRETALVTLLKVKDPECREVLWQYGLSHSDGIVRAYAARVCGRLKIDSPPAVEKLRAQLADSSWYARAEAAVALGAMKDVKSLAAFRKMAETDASERARVGAMDAIAAFREDPSGQSVAVLVKSALDHAQWQIRLAAVQTLAELGSMESIDPLIARMEKETGRVRDEIYVALKKISRDDLGRKPESWRSWWNREKANNPNGLPPRPDDKKKPKGPDPNDPHATHDAGPPPYFGVEIYSSRIAFILDTSESMGELFQPDPAAANGMFAGLTGHDKLSIAKDEIKRALGGLDPRAHFNVVTFGTQIRAYNNAPVQATPANVSSANSWLEQLPAQGETNYYDALKAALDIGGEPDTNPDFKATPDTITFLTDGEPTKGDILDADVLLEWYTGLNRYARVKTHTITFGLIGVDMPLLRGMAERNGGVFTIVPELPTKKRR